MNVKFDFPLLKKQCNDEYNYEKKKRDIISKYKGIGYAELNNALRKKPSWELDDEQRDFADSLNQIIIDQERSKKENILYRGISDAEFISNWLSNKKYKVGMLSNIFEEAKGECMWFREFLSTTYDPRIAITFSEFYGESLILKFKLPPNFPMLAVDEVLSCTKGIPPKASYDLSEEFDNENEILLPMNMLYQIVSINKRLFHNKLYTIITLDPRGCPQLTYQEGDSGF
jgi:hypothetical protein